MIRGPDHHVERFDCDLATTRLWVLVGSRNFGKINWLQVLKVRTTCKLSAQTTSSMQRPSGPVWDTYVLEYDMGSILILISDRGRVRLEKGQTQTLAAGKTLSLGFVF